MSSFVSPKRPRIDHIDSASESDTQPTLRDAERQWFLAQKLRRRLDKVIGRYLEGDIYVRRVAEQQLQSVIKLTRNDALAQTFQTLREHCLADDETDRPGYDGTVFDIQRALLAQVAAFKDGTEARITTARVFELLAQLRRAVATIDHTITQIPNGPVGVTTNNLIHTAMHMCGGDITRAAAQTQYKVVLAFSDVWTLDKTCGDAVDILLRLREETNAMITQIQDDIG